MKLRYLLVVFIIYTADASSILTSERQLAYLRREPKRNSSNISEESNEHGGEFEIVLTPESEEKYKKATSAEIMEIVKNGFIVRNIANTVDVGLLSLKTTMEEKQNQQ